MEVQVKSAKAIIYYDGLCRACSLEINHYRKLAGAENFKFQDIMVSDFKAEDHGLDPALVHHVMHVRDANGKLHQGVEAFQAIWKELPRYHFLARLSENSAFHALLQMGYNAFVKIRPYLPRKKADCSQSPYCEVSK